MNVLHKADASNRSKVLAAAGKWETWKTGATEHLPHDSVKLSFDFECRKWPKEFSGEWKSAPALCQMFCSSLSMLHVGCWMCARQMQLKRLNSLPRRLHYMGGMCVAF